MGLTEYYRKFIVGYARMAAPLTDQLKKDCFLWNEQATEAFLSLKGALMQAPILSMFDFTKIFVIESDVSGVGIGAILTQD